MEENNLNESTPVSNNLCDITSITNFSNKNKRNINDELLSLLKWLNEDFVPVAMYEIKSYNANQMKKVEDNLLLVKDEFQKIIKFIRWCKNKGNTEENSEFWNEFLASERFDELMASLPSVHKQISSSTSECSSSSTPRHPQVVKKVARPLINQVAERLVTHLDDSAVESFNRLSINSNENVMNENENSLPMENSSLHQECCVTSRKHANFKFNFNVWYSNNIERLIYAPSKKFNVINIDNLDMPTIQFRSASIYKCLICCCEASLTASNRCIYEHVHGNKHSSRKSQEERIKQLYAYHKVWINQEHYYQAHQVYFYPHTTDAVVCYLCVKAVPFDLIVYHIHTELHKKDVLKVVDAERSVLSNLQEYVYLTAEEVALRENASTSRNSQLSISDCNERVPTSKPKKNKGLKKPLRKHKIILSVADPNGNTIKLRLEYRFWPQLQLLTLVNNKLNCTCCGVAFENEHDAIIRHLHSNDHLSKVNIKQVNEFYCELCALTIRDNEDWFMHLCSSNHKRRCSVLKEERKQTLAEYECLTCQVVIFGDNLSIKRHQDLSRRIPKAEVTLGRQVIELFSSTEYLENYAKQLVDESNKMLLNSQPMIYCVQALETSLRTTYPNCKVYPFGSRVSGLGNEKSDLDVFVDIGDMYLGDDNQDRHSQEKYVYGACKVFRKLKNEFSNINPIPTARTPIVQVYHIPTDIDCDLSFKHGLSVENTKFLRLCIRLQPVTQSLILVLKQWAKYCKIDEYVTTYALAMMVIFYLQIQNLLFPITKLKNLSSASILFVNGWSIMDFTDVAEEVQNYITPYLGSLKSILVEFFDYYKSFDFASDIICPLLGHPIKKQLFATKPEKNLPEELSEYVEKCLVPNAEELKTRAPICIQDPFDLSHNLTKACTVLGVDKFKAYCELSGGYLNRSS